MFVIDHKVILNLNELYWVKKEDCPKPLRSDTEFKLLYNYRGIDGSIVYNEKEDRDTIFNRICDALNKLNLVSL